MPFPLDSDTWLAPAEPADEAVILALARAFHAQDGHPLSDRGEHAIAQILGDSALGLVFKIMRADRAIGYAALCFGFSIEWGRDAFLDDLYVVPAERGRGLGRLAIRQLIAAARDAGCGAVHLEVMQENPAGELYRAFGFADRGKLMTRPLLR
jgi:GNAT superfamily N-acetyltransferase